MKKQYLPYILVLTLSLAMLMPACKDDDEPANACAGVTCQNGGSCADGTCFCPDGFMGPNCEEVDPCYEANTNNEWGYDDFGGPACWNDVCCGTGCSGDHQSPINIVGAVPNTNLPELVFGQFVATPTKIVNKGHTIEFEQEPGTYLTYGATENGLSNDYTLGQFHFHAQSEHQVESNHAPLEAHLVFRSIWRNEYIVIGVMFEEGDSNPLLAQFVDPLPTSVTQPPYENEALI